MDTKNFNWGVFSKYRNIIYGLSCISVILLHFCNRIPEIGYNGKYYFKMIYKGLINNIGVDFFVLLTGICLYFSMKKNPNIQEFYKKRFSRILIPYILIGVPYYFVKDMVYADLGIKEFFLDITFINMPIQGDKDLWYIACIIVMYIIYPWLHKLYDRFKERKILICAVLCATSVIFNFTLKYTEPLLYKNTEIMLLRFPIFFIGAYLGQKVYEAEPFKRKHYIIFVIATIINGIVDFYLIINKTYIARDLNRYFNIISMIVYSGIFILIASIIKEKFKSRFVKLCGLLSLELYIVHMCFLKILEFFDYPIWRYRYFAVFFAISILMSQMVSQMTSHIVTISKKEKNI